MLKRDREQREQTYPYQFLGIPLALSTVGLTCLFTYPVSAQVIPDNSLDNDRSIVTPNVTVKDALADLIEGGAIRGNNLFHSFEQFNISDGGRVYFANPDGIANILTRVTGNNLSEIFGTLGVDGAANLFLLNPNGIVFGKNAALDVNGSFFATTADSYVFENGFAYSASNPDAPPLLTINIPVGVQFGSQAESIVNQSLSLNDFDESVGLEVPPESNLTLVGGEINFEGGVVTAPNGSIELSSVAPNNLVNIIPTENNWTLDYTGIENFQDINLTQAASISSSGDGAGKINIYANNVSVLDGSTILANNYGEEDGGSLNINTQELVRVAGANSDGFSSLIAAEVGDMGDGADLTIETKSLQVTDGSIVATGNFGTGQGGNLTIKAKKEVLLSGTDIYGYGSLIATNTYDSGDGGDLSINVERLTLDNDGSQVSTSTFGDGNAGNLTVHVSESIEISGAGLVSVSEDEQALFSSGLFANVGPGATGNGGNLTVETDALRISEGGKIATNTLGTGDAGNISIHANNLEVKGSVVNNQKGTRNGINSTVEFEGSGNGGNLDIVVNNLDLIDGGSIAVDTKGQGHAGNINIQAQKINISGVSSSEPFHGLEQQSLPSEISASSLGDYDAGSITINTETLNLNNQGDISVSNLADGNAGNISITTAELNLNNSATLEAEVNAGSQGNINLITENIFLRHNSEITAKATGTATGGNITINNTDNIVLLDNSKIIADAIQGNGGNINITTQGLFVSRDSSITASSEYALDGNVEIEEINGDRNLELNYLPENIVDTTELITSSCLASDNNGFAITGNGGIPNSPYSNQSLNTTWYDLRRVSHNQEIVGYISPVLKEANTTIINSEGEIELIALTPLSSYRWVKSSCGR